MDLTGLDPERLCLFLLGPGYGESVVLRLPPNHWLVVDSFRWRGVDGGQETSALRLLRSAGARLEGVVLTHPHDDHAPGLADLLDAYPDAWIGCAEHWFVPPFSDDLDLEQKLREGSVAHTLAAIRTAWGDPSRKLTLVAGARRSVGDATITVLYPPQGVHTDTAVNALSSPVLLTWHGVRILLGADLPSAQWSRVESGFGVHRHHAYKVAHHCSKNAVNPGVLRQGGERTWIATPWNRYTRLPRFEDGEGIEMLLKLVDRVHLTALPSWIGMPPPIEVTRRDVQAGVRIDPDLGVSVTLVPRASPTMDGWIRAEFNRAGDLCDMRMGPLALTIVSEKT